MTQPLPAASPADFATYVARREQAGRRHEVWLEARHRAETLYGWGTERDDVMAVLHGDALNEDEDRWIEALPPCSGPCITTHHDCWSQAGHLPSCERGRAWRQRMKLGRR